MSKSKYEDYFVQHGILGASHKSKAAEIILKAQPTLEAFSYSSPSGYIRDIWSKLNGGDKNLSLAGQMFELVLACILLREGIQPFYMAAEVQHVPNAKFDLLLLSEEYGPVVLSAKTSLRERYKQADLEAQALRAVYRRSRTFLVTLDEGEAANVQRKIEIGSVLNLEKVVVASSDDFDRLIIDLSAIRFIPSQFLPSIKVGRFVS